jgi:outer membrane protein assembly factor BamE
MPRAGVARYPFSPMKKTLMITLLLAGCGNVPMLPSLQPYKIEIQQGNYVTQDMVAKLKPGMTRSQVRFALGTPLIVDPFRTDRWDYVYMLHKQGNLVEQRQVTVVFKGEVLDRIEGDVVAGTAAPAGAKTAAPVVKPEAQEKK